MNLHLPNKIDESRVNAIIELLEKIEKAEKINKTTEAEINIQSSTPTQGTIEVNLPLYYRQFPGIK